MQDDESHGTHSGTGRMGAFLIVIPPLALGLWLIALRPASGSLSGDWFTLILTLIVLALLSGILIAGIIPVVAPLMTRQEQRAISWLLGAGLLLPLMVATLWSTGSGTPVRAAGEIPNVAALLGQNESTVERLLGNTVRANGWDASSTLVAIPAAIRSQTHPVVYGLPDLSTNNQRGTQRPPSGATSERVSSDAKVIVFYSADGRALVADLELNRTKAESLLGQQWLGKLPTGAGLGTRLEAAAAPSWAESDYRSGMGVDRWGSATLENRQIAYHVHATLKAPAEVRSAGIGAVSLTVGEGLFDPTVVPTADDGNAQDASSQSGDGSSSGRKATDDFCDRTFYAILLAQESSPEAARRSADIFNKRATASGEASPAVVVEGTGHLRLSDDESYVVVYVIGYETQQAAWRQASRLWWPLRTTPSVRQVTKRCGDLSFIAIQ